MSLNKLLKKFDISDSKIEKLNKLRDICLEYNKNVNLTSITEKHDFNIKHILDSISILSFYELNNKKILDVGTGGGFPGLVLAIILDKSEITMLDSNNKKIKYVNYVTKKLNIKNVSTINSRIEETNINEKFDVVVSRAVASLNVLLEITAFSIKIGGKAIYYKGSNLEEEIPDNWTVIENLLGLKLDSINDFNLDTDIVRKIISFDKIKRTNKEYPRHFSQVVKNPIY